MSERKMLPQRTVMLLEDSEAQRLALHEALAMRGFSVESAADVATARGIAKSMAPDLDVVVLDMRLEDSREPAMTGADLGLEILAAQRRWPPEFLILSAFAEVDYYKLAMRLGAAAYLQKHEHPQDQAIRHIRALAIRRHMSAEKPGVVERNRSIARESRDRSEAAVRFCREILGPEFDVSLGAPYLILFSDASGTHCCINNAGLPEKLDSVYEILQAVAHGQVNQVAPFVFDPVRIVPTGVVDQNEGCIAKLDGAAFLPLSIGRDIRLSVGILQEKRGLQSLSENAVELAKVLMQYFGSAILHHLLNLLSKWAELNARRQAVLHATSHFCLFVGQEQVAAMSELADSEESLSGNPTFLHLQTLARDLCDTGKILVSLGVDVAESTSGARLRSVSAADLVQSIWEDLTGQLPSQPIAFELLGDCRVATCRDDLDLLIIVSRILQWLSQRALETPPGVSPLIRVECAEPPGGPQIVLEDRSRRLRQDLRERLFDPFAQAVPPPSSEGGVKGPGLHLPLYLAKMLVEMKYGGVLEDRTEELADNAGHRFVISFPRLAETLG